jgi:hypothetical protein
MAVAREAIEFALLASILWRMAIRVVDRHGDVRAAR